MVYFWLNFCNDNQIDRIDANVQNIDHIFNLAIEIMGTAGRFYLFLFSDGTRIDGNNYLETLKNGTELVVCTEEQVNKLLFYLK